MHGITGMLGVFVENFFIAKAISSPDENWGLLLGFNEINWVLHDSSTVYYLLVKLEVNVSLEFMKKVLRGVMAMLFVVFAIFRIIIGIDRVRFNTTYNAQIARDHSYAFIIWGVADVIIFSLMWNTLVQLKNSQGAYKALIAVVFKSSVPGISILVVNTLLIVILGQIRHPDQTAEDFNSLAWIIKGTYPIILLLDLQSTKNMLVQEAETARRKSTFQTSGKSVISPV